MSKKDHKGFVELAKHFSGKKTQFKKIPKVLKAKVLNGVFTDIGGSQHKSDLIRGLCMEDRLHKIDPDFHRGGGLWDGMSNLLSVGTNYATSFIEPLGWMQNVYDWYKGYKYTADIPENLKQQVDLIKQAKKVPGKRDKSVHGWELVPEGGTDRISIYKDVDKKDLYITVRGTDQKNISDLYQDYKILKTGNPESKEVKQALLAISEKYGDDFDLNLLSYSLGGAQVTEAFTSDSGADQKKLLDDYDQITLVNPGSSPFADGSHIKSFLGDDRVKLLANRSDIISAEYQQYADASRSYWGARTHNALHSHDDEQFGTTPPEWDETRVGSEGVLAGLGLGSLVKGGTAVAEGTEGASGLLGALETVAPILAL